MSTESPEGSDATKIDQVLALLDLAKADLANAMMNLVAAKITGMTVQVGAEALGIDMRRILAAAQHTDALHGEFVNLDKHIDDDKAAWQAAKESKW